MTTSKADTRIMQRLAHIADEQHIRGEETSEWYLTNGGEQIDYDGEGFTRTASTRFMPAIEYRSPTRYLYRLPDTSLAVLWTAADYTEFDCYDGNLTAGYGYELWMNHEWLVLSNGISIEDELENWQPRTPLKTVMADITRITKREVPDPATAISEYTPVNLEDHGIDAGTVDDMDVLEAIIDDSYDSLRRDYGFDVAHQWAKEKRVAIHQWMRQHDQHVIDGCQRKAGTR
jgi:hypothetical protein